MGKASRWLRSLLLGGKKPAAVAGGDTHKPIKEKRGWGFARSFRDVDQHRRGVVEDEMSVAVNEVRKGASYREAGPRSYAPSVASSRATGGAPSRAPPPIVDDEEQQKRAIAVAAATAAVAEAAVAAAQAAAAVVRLTSSGRCPALYGAIGRKREKWAAVRIQAAFRGYLARRALRALRGLVKLQALVRGHIVRKQAAETLRCMHALVRVQARARACRELSENRRCNEGSRQIHLGPTTPQKFEPSLGANYAKSDRGRSNLKRGDHVVDFIDPAGGSAQSWKWMDRWMEDRYWDSREASWRTGGATDDEKNDKILEVDTGKPHSNYKRRGGNQYHSSSSTLASDLNSRSFATVQDSPSKDSFVGQFSIPSPSSVDMQQQPPLSPLGFALEARAAYESPQVPYPASSRPGSARGGGGPFTPAKSECSRSFFGGYSDHPSYMANTESSRAKLRSQSAPKQRPDYEKLSTLRRVQVVGAGCGHSSSSSSQRSASQLQLKFTSKDYPGSGRLVGMGMPMRY